MKTERIDFSKSIINSVLTIIKGKEINGFDIALSLEKDGERAFVGNEGELYVLLHNLEREKLVKSRERKDYEFRRRRYYRLTRRGIDSLKENGGAQGEKVYYEAWKKAVPSGGTRIHAEKFFQWCSEAASAVVISPDKEDIIRELTEHIEDRYRFHLINDGMEPRQAETQAIEDMGDASKCAKLFGEIHPPFWGKAYHITRKIATVMFVIVLISLSFFWLYRAYIMPKTEKFDPQRGPVLHGVNECIYEEECNKSLVSDGYAISLEHIALWQNTYKDEPPAQLLNVRLVTSGPGNWSQPPAFSGWIWARDSLGNIYYSNIEDTTSVELAVSVTDYKTGPIEYTHDIWFYDYSSSDAEWIELVYDRSGREIVFRVDIPGGDS